MKCEVHFTRGFWDDVDGESRGTVERLAAQIEETGLRENGAMPYFEPLGRGFFKKRVGNRRLLAYVLPSDEVGRQAVLMLQYVPRSAGDYEPNAEALLKRHEAEIERVKQEVAATPPQADARVQPLPPVPGELLPFIHPNRVGMTVGGDRTHTVYLTKEVVAAYNELPKARQVHLYEALEHIVNASANEHGELQEHECPEFIVHHTGVVDKETNLKEDIVWGIVPKENTTAIGHGREQIMRRYRQFMEDFRARENWGQSAEPRSDIFSQYADRAFPWYIVADQELLESAFEDRESFLALSSEEMRVLERAVASEHLPLVIEGRAGSGKSTLLNYYMAERLGSLDRWELQDLNARFVLYVTQSKRLLERARNLVQRLLKRIRAELGPDRAHGAGRTLAEFQTYHEFALQQLPPELRVRYAERERRGGYVDFPRFRDLLHRDPPHKAKLGGVSPEAAWFVIRSYIKGYKIHEQGDERWMTPEEYFDGETVSRKDRQVSEDLFGLVWEKIWPWYKQRTIEREAASGMPRYWDDLDLAWDVLHSRRPDANRYLGIVCDEIQDLSRVEIAALIRSLLWFDYDLSPLCNQGQFRLPVVLAGDAHQTVHPSSFRWDRVSADLTSAILHHVPALTRFSPKEEPLRFNYRNAPSIAELCNGLQNLRQTTIGGRADLQRIWRIEDNVANQRVRSIVVDGPEGGDVIRELLDQGVFFIGPEDDDPELEASRQFWEALGVQRDPDQQNRENYVTPAEIKGLEQGCVAILGFGTSFAQKCPQDFWKWRKASEDEEVPEDQRFRVEHFLNNLYVAASRASEQLWIVETSGGWKAFWEPLRQQLEGELKAEGCSFTCSSGTAEELVGASRGEWPTLARDLETLAHDQRNPDHAERAAFYYQRAEDQLAARKMLAYAKRYRGDLAAAADEIESIEPDIAANWRWEACEWGALAAMATIEAWRRELAGLMAELERLQRPDAPATEKTRLGEIVLKIAATFVRLWREGRTDLERGGRAPWLRILQVLLDHYETVLEKSGRVAPGDLRAIETAAEEATPYLREEKQRIRWMDTLARVAFRRGEFEKAVQWWERAGQSDSEQYYVAKARITPYPERLQWLDSAGDLQEIWREYESHKDIALRADDERRIARVATALRKWDEALPRWAELDPRELVRVWENMLKNLGTQQADAEGDDFTRRLVRLMQAMYSRIQTKLPQRDAALRWSDILFDMLIVLWPEGSPSPTHPALARELVRGFAWGSEGGALASRLTGAWESQKAPNAAWPRLKQVLQFILDSAERHAADLFQRGDWEGAVNLAALAFHLVWDRRTLEPARDSGERDRTKPKREFEFQIRSYVRWFSQMPEGEGDDEDEKKTEIGSRSQKQQPSGDDGRLQTLQGLDEEAWRLVAASWNTITTGPDDWLREHAERCGAAGQRLYRDLETLCAQLNDEISLLARANVPHEPIPWPRWLDAGRLIEHAPFRLRALDFYTSLLEYAEDQQWPEEAVNAIRDRLERYSRRYDRWKSDSQSSKSRSARRERPQIRVPPNGERRNEAIRVRSYPQYRAVRVEFLSNGYGIRFEAGAQSQPPRLQADPELKVEGPLERPNETVWNIQSGSVGAKLRFDPGKRELRIESGADGFTVALP